jgi:hypothetical protein
MSRDVLTYPHDPATYEPRRMRAPEIWRTAAAVRGTLIPHARRPKVELGALIARCRSLSINGIEIPVRWELGAEVCDDDGQPVLGVTMHDHGAACIALNMELIGANQELARSTAMHELGHAVFDAPAWIREGAGTGQTRQLRPKGAASQERDHGADWSEWRANEFMGGFLVPERLLHPAMVKHAASIGVPLTSRLSTELPVLMAPRSWGHGYGVLMDSLGELFGVSASFIEVRLRKYRLLYSGD